MLEGGTFIISILVIVRNHFEVFALMDRRFRNPGRGVQVGFGRKSPEFNGTWKQYSRLENFGNFRITSSTFLSEMGGGHRKIFKIFQSGILLPYSIEFQCFPAGSGRRNHRPKNLLFLRIFIER